MFCRGIMKQTTAKIFQSGGSQAVRLPKEFRFDVQEVFIVREGDRVILSPKPLSWQSYFAKPTEVPGDFLTDREDNQPQERELF